MTKTTTPGLRIDRSVRPPRRQQLYHSNFNVLSCNQRDRKSLHYQGHEEEFDAVRPGTFVKHLDVPSRRDFCFCKSPALASSLFVFLCAVTEPSSSSAAAAATVSLPLVVIPAKERRQLELCLVTLLRVIYFTQYIADGLQPSAAPNSDARRNTYLEARLGCKAILTGRVGGGATGRVYTLGSLKLPACLEDLEWYASNSNTNNSDNNNNNNEATRRQRQRVADLRRDFSEALASVVEFDGLETLQDPSPRSSLTLAQYNDNKAAFVQRTMLERLIPTGRQLVRCFPSDAIERSYSYIQQYYSNELPENSGIKV